MAIAKHKAQRVGVFIDTANLYHSAKNLYKSKVNFGNIVADLVGDRTLVRAIAYVITTEGGEEKAFFEALEKVGIETKAKELQIFYGGSKKADWDVGISLDAIGLAPKLDTVIIVAGDGDFIPLVEHLKMQTQVEVAMFGQSTSGKLREVADHFYDLSENKDRYLIQNRSMSHRSKSTSKSASPYRSGGTANAKVATSSSADKTPSRTPGRAPTKTAQANSSSRTPVKTGPPSIQSGIRKAAKPTTRKTTRK